MNIQEATPVVLTGAERAVLERMVASPLTSQQLAQRARIVLLAADEWPTRQIAAKVGCTIGTASKWRVRYAEFREAGLHDLQRPGSAPKYTEETDRRILAQLDRSPPAGYARWTAPLLSQALKDVSDQYIWRFLRAQRIDLSARKSWCISKDPEFGAKTAEIIGLYLNPPEGALVLSIDEKPSIQALERAQGYLRLPNGRALKGQTHEYKRHGTTTLFAALDVATGQVKAGHYKRRRRIEFLDFMNKVVADQKDREIHVILDNLSTHKPKRDLWLSRHPNVRFHFTPTHASWMNQIEVWFSILTRNALAGDSFTSPTQVRQRIDAFVAAYNQAAKPFAWRKTHVHQKDLEPRFADL